MQTVNDGRKLIVFYDQGYHLLFIVYLRSFSNCIQINLSQRS